MTSRPPLAVKAELPATYAPLQTSPTKGISPLTRQYVVPPRPKPGRKPATDTPPTRRKAQNRAAQRAFRERRAAKVNELEDEMTILRKEHESEINEIKAAYDSQIRQSAQQHQESLRTLHAELNSWRIKFADLEARLVERHISNEEAQASYQTPPANPEGCGDCVPGGSCRCIDQFVDVDMTLDQKRQPSPHLEQQSSYKRPRTSDAEMEIDFTHFAGPTKYNEPLIKQEPETSDCSNGPGTCSRCKANPKQAVLCTAYNSIQPVEQKFSTSASTETGTCALGANCCKVSNTLYSTSRSNRPQMAAGAPLISCAEAFNQLSTHKAFDKASKELGDWLPMLKTVPRRDLPDGGPSSRPTHATAADMAGKSSFEIDAASVLSVLSFYDTRYKDNS